MFLFTKTSVIKSDLQQILLLTYVTPPTRVRTNSPSWLRTRDSGAGGRRSNEERQRLQPLASVARAPLFEVR